MMSNDNTGGPAFPNPALANEDWCGFDGCEGMSLRDWFAGQVIASVKGWHPADKHGKSAAAIAYEIADDMMRAREGGDA